MEFEQEGEDTVVGVVPNSVQKLPESDIPSRSFIFRPSLPAGQRPAPQVDFPARASVPTESLENTFRREIQRMDPVTLVVRGVGLQHPDPAHAIRYE